MNRNWYRDEFNITGTDFKDPRVIADYDRQMARLRDPDAEFNGLLAMLDPRPGWAVADIGCGTAEFSVRLARICRKVYALDVSGPMLDYAALKAGSAGLDNIEFIRAGFLTWERPPEPLDAAVSCMSLHHLPDFWKIAALRSVNRWLKPGGRLYLQDVVFSFPSGEYDTAFDRWVEFVGSSSPGMRESAELHIRNEFSTTAAVMRSVIGEAGFEITAERQSGGFLGYFACRKPGEEGGQ
jgi:ubiquinone/menaquinone biosynthesis C-methylase UbiE